MFSRQMCTPGMQKGTWHKTRRVNIELIFEVELDSVEIQEHVGNKTLLLKMKKYKPRI